MLPLALATAAVAALALGPGPARAGAAATTRFTAVTPGPAAAGGVQFRQLSLPDELITVGQGYPLLLEPASLTSDTEHSLAVAQGTGAAFLQDSWTSPFGSAAITLNEIQTGQEGLVYSDLNDQFAQDNPGDGTALRHATAVTAAWGIATGNHRASHSLFLKLHGMLDPTVQGDRWLMAAGQGAFTASGGGLGTLTSPFAWSLGFDGGGAASRADFFTLSLPSDWSVRIRNFVIGREAFSLDLEAGVSFVAPDDLTTLTLASTFSCAALNAVCGANTITISDPLSPAASAPAPLPLAGLGLGRLLSLRMRAKKAGSLPLGPTSNSSGSTEQPQRPKMRSRRSMVFRQDAAGGPGYPDPLHSRISQELPKTI